MSIFDFFRSKKKKSAEETRTTNPSTSKPEPTSSSAAMSPSAQEVTPSVTNAAHGETIATQGESHQIPVSTNGDTNGHSNGTNGASDNGANDFHYGEEVDPSSPYRVLKQYHSKPTKLRVACVGAGASGLCLAYKMERMMIPGTWELTLFEKNPHFGGTWYENVYPGVACDVSQPIAIYVIHAHTC